VKPNLEVTDKLELTSLETRPAVKPVVVIFVVCAYAPEAPTLKSVIAEGLDPDLSPAAATMTTGADAKATGNVTLFVICGVPFPA
jgi:hypothetical protein